MEPLAYVLSLLLLPLSLLCLISFLRKPSTKNLPPGTRGWPILGESVAFCDPEKFIDDRMKKHSPDDVIQTSLFGERMAMFCGPQANKFLFMNESKFFSTTVSPSTTKVLFSSEFSTQGSTSKPTVFSDFLKPEILKQYIPVMDALAHQHMDRDWTPNNVVKVVPLSKRYTLELACRQFLSMVDHQQIKELLDAFEPVTGGMFSMPIDFPGTALNRGIKGGKMVREKIMRIIKERRKELAMETMELNDLLSKLLLVTDPSGDISICNVMIGLLVASFESTSSAITSVINYLASLPHIYEEVLKEQMEIVKAKGPGELLTWEDIEKMKFSWNVARESLRLTPPAPGGFKETMVEFTYAGFTIPKGWKIFWNFCSSHKDPKYFPEPKKFDPSRFEGSGPAPYAFVPFGGGSRMCPGREFARLEILVFIHNVVRRFGLEKVFPDEKMVFKCSKHTPAYGLPIRLHPHQN